MEKLIRTLSHLLLLIEEFLSTYQNILIVGVLIIGLLTFGLKIYQIISPGKKFAAKKQELKDVHTCLKYYINQKSETSNLQSTECWTDLSVLDDELKSLLLNTPKIDPGDKNTWTAYSEWLLEITKFSSSGNIKKARKFTKEYIRNSRKNNKKFSNKDKKRPFWDKISFSKEDNKVEDDKDRGVSVKSEKEKRPFWDKISFSKEDNKVEDDKDRRTSVKSKEEKRSFWDKIF